MYIQIGTKDKPANIKVAGGFIAETPIIRVTSSTILQSAYYGTTESKFTKPLQDYHKLGQTLNVNLSYFKSYEDYLNLEQPLSLNTDMAAIPNNNTGIQNSYYSLPFIGTLSEKAIYDALVVKLTESYENVKIVTE